MRRRFAVAALLVAAAAIFPVPVKAQGAKSAETSCNIKAKVEDLKKKSSTDGAGLMVRAVLRDLRNFKKNLTELMGKPGIYPTNPVRRRALEEQYKKFADIEGDLGEYQ